MKAGASAVPKSPHASTWFEAAPFEAETLPSRLALGLSSSAGRIDGPVHVLRGKERAMKRRLTIFLWLAVAFGLSEPQVMRGADPKSSPASGPAKAKPTTYLRIRVKGVIGRDFSAEDMKAHLARATSLKPTVIVLEIDTPGGAVMDAEKIVDLMIESKGLRFVALVRKGLSAGVPIALACPEIYVTETATIGAATSYLGDKTGRPMVLPRDVAEKFQSVWRAVCRKAADSGRHPSLLAEAMADPGFALTMRKHGKRIVFERDGKGDTLKAKGRILTLTAREACSCGLVRGTAADFKTLGQKLGAADWVDAIVVREAEARAAQVLLDAVGRDDLSPVQALLHRGMDANARGRHGESPLHEAPSRRMAELLLKNGAHVEAKDDAGRTPLHRAITGGHEDVAELLVANGADVNAKDSDGSAPLHLTMRRRIVRLLLNKGARVNTRDKNRRTALHMAVKYGGEEAASILLTEGADVHAEDSSGMKPLYWAILSGQQELAKLLLAKGAGGQTKDQPGKKRLVPFDNVVYLLDSTGSMLVVCYVAQSDMLRSMFKLRATQSFHIVSIAGCELVENTPRRLVRGMERNKLAAVKFSRSLQTGGNPPDKDGVLTALTRSFQVLGTRPGTKAIFFFSDGYLASGRHVLKHVRQLNRDKQVKIFTIQYGEGGGTRGAEAVGLMRRIAQETGGEYKVRNVPRPKTEVAAPRPRHEPVTAPEALAEARLRVARTYKAAGVVGKAKDILESIIRQYPRTKAAEEARRQLKKMAGKSGP